MYSKNLYPQEVIKQFIFLNIMYTPKTTSHHQMAIARLIFHRITTELLNTERYEERSLTFQLTEVCLLADGLVFNE